MISFGAGWQTRGWRFCLGRQVGHRFEVGLFFRSHMHSSARTRAVVILFHVGGAVQGAVALVATGRQRPRHCSPINIQPASQAAVLPCLHEAQTGLGNGGELGGNHCKNGSNSGSVTSCHAERNGRGGEIRTHDLLYPKQARYQATLRPEPSVGAEGAHSPVQLQPCFLPCRNSMRMSSW